jgi:rRNA-processing protein FCF1
VSTRALERAVVGWNRSRLDLDSDEVLAQVLDRGDLAAWRELYTLAANDRRLRRRILGIVSGVPLPYPCFWRAAMASLGERVDWSAPLPSDPGIA